MKRRHRPAASLGLTGFFIFIAFIVLLGQNPPAQQTAPGQLSKTHAALEGAANCGKCHAAGKTIEAKRCLACHKPIADRMAAQKGVHREISGDCEVCHQEHQGADADIRPLDPADFDHAEEAGFALLGNHAKLAENCPACHKIRSYLGNSENCVSCHADPHQGGMPERCEACHSPSGWTSVSRGFHKSGTFPLEGRHLDAPCAACHLNGVFKGTPMRCYDCHWIRRQDDRYRTALGTDCENCHRPISWTAVHWDHGARTGTPLNAAHLNLSCDNCHKGGRFQNVGFDCYACHREDYEETEEPNHARAGFPTSCELCHLPSHTSWDQASFDHNSIFLRQGVHATLECTACHKNGVYAGIPRDCYGCHRADYESTRDPNHAAAGFPTSCEVCHKPTDTDWDQADFNHSSVFALQGVHATLNCAACHKNNVYRGTPRDCYGCHRADYESTRDPNHVSAGFPTTCESCHRASDTSWDQADLDHNRFYPLQGVHRTLSCTVCHKNNVYDGTPRDCYGCHRADYEAARGPNHVAAGFPTTCESCHRASDTSWDQADLDHSSFYPLQGVHATQDCTACHVNSVYAGTPRDCYGCHRADYEGARDPNHVAAGFPTSCESCHGASDTSWDQAQFNHIWFPITSGRHSGNNCSACHPNSENFTVFNCLSCHSRGETDGHHSGVSGYRYDSAACYSCHPQGRE